MKREKRKFDEQVSEFLVKWVERYLLLEPLLYFIRENIKYYKKYIKKYIEEIIIDDAMIPFYVIDKLITLEGTQST